MGGGGRRSRVRRVRAAAGGPGPGPGGGYCCCHCGAAEGYPPCGGTRAEAVAASCSGAPSARAICHPGRAPIRPSHRRRHLHRLAPSRLPRGRVLPIRRRAYRLRNTRRSRTATATICTPSAPRAVIRWNPGRPPRESLPAGVPPAPPRSSRPRRAGGESSVARRPAPAHRFTVRAAFLLSTFFFASASFSSSLNSSSSASSSFWPLLSCPFVCSPARLQRATAAFTRTPRANAHLASHDDRRVLPRRRLRASPARPRARPRVGAVV